MSGPIAEPFNALGRGNGFPFCIPELDVTGYDLVAPLTLDQAMMLFWNLHMVKCITTGEYNTQFPTAELETEVEDVTAVILTGVSPEIIPIDAIPKKRVCLNSITGQNADSDAAGDSDFFFLQSLASINITGLRALIDNGEHIGYGFQNIATVQSSAIEDAGAEFFTAFVRLRSYIQNTSTAQGNSYALVEVNEIPLVVHTLGLTLSDPENLTAQSIGGYDDPEITYDLRASVTDLEFYQYPS